MPSYILDAIGRVVDLDKIVISNGKHMTKYEFLSNVDVTGLVVIVVLFTLAVCLSAFIQVYLCKRMVKKIASDKGVAAGEVMSTYWMGTGNNSDRYANVEFDVDGVRSVIRVLGNTLSEGDKLNVYYCKHDTKTVLIDRDYELFDKKSIKKNMLRAFKVVCVFYLFMIVMLLFI